MSEYPPPCTLKEEMHMIDWVETQNEYPIIKNP